MAVVLDARGEDENEDCEDGSCGGSAEGEVVGGELMSS